MNGIYVEVAGKLAWFAADVWAAKTIIRAEWGAGFDTPTRIANWLWNEGLSHEYAQSSLRPRIYASLKIIEDLELFGETPEEPPFWQPWAFLYELEAIATGSD